MAQPRIPLIAVLIHGTEATQGDRVDALRAGMRDLGYDEGRTYRMEVRWSGNQLDRLPALSRELLALSPNVAVGAPVLGAQAFHRQSKTVPIVMATGSGALQAGLIASIARPGGNVTGLTNQGDELTQKLFELLREVAPRARRVVTLSSGHALIEQETRTASRAAARSLGFELIEVRATSPAEIRGIATQCARDRCEAIVVLLDPTLTAERAEVVALGTKLRLPLVSAGVEYAEAGGLIGFLADNRQLFRRAASYVDKILKGADPANMPIEQPTKFETVVNKNTAKMLGITVPHSILLRADRVIE